MKMHQASINVISNTNIQNVFRKRERKKKTRFCLLSFCLAPLLYSRNRQNSVFVGPQIVTQKPSRKYRSAMDIHSMVLDEAAEPV